MSKRLLQVVTAGLGLIPVVTGAVMMLGVDDPLYAVIGLPKSSLLDSNLRFFAGVWLGLGIALLWTVPSIERQGTLFRVAWGAVFPSAAWAGSCRWRRSARLPRLSSASPSSRSWARPPSCTGSIASPPPSATPSQPTLG